MSTFKALPISKTQYMQISDAVRKSWENVGPGISHKSTHFYISSTWETHILMEGLAMMASGDGAAPELLRVSIDDEGKFDIVDFTTPSVSGRVLLRHASQGEVPQWVIEAVSMLRITDRNSVVQGVGFKVQDRVYYIVDRRDEHGYF